MGFKLSFLVLIVCAFFGEYHCFEYTTKYFDQKIDHFNFKVYGDGTFQQRYLLNDTFWDRNSGPVFFYAGNEGPITGFWENTGFMFDIAPQFKALILFAEHRYYGTSLPFGEMSFTGESVGLLSIEQALADYAFLLEKVLEDLGAPNATVIAFGGSYGGMLAAYMRYKYPNIISGSIAASAPIYLVAGLQFGGASFFQTVTKDFRDVTPKCEMQVRKAYSQMQAWANQGKPGLQKISRYFHLCKELETEADYRHLILWSRNAFVSAAMGDYPYPANFVGNFPGFPVKVMCNLLLGADTPVAGLWAANGLYYNSSGTSKCFDIYEEYIECADPTGCGLGDSSKAWDYQACTEINLEESSNGVTDMFPAIPFNSSLRDEYCKKTWGVLPRRNWLKTLFWGNKISTTSNIVFSNGDLDPWGPGGVLSDISDTVVAVLVKGGAHHLDLRGANPADPPTVVEARKTEVEYIKKWIASSVR